MNLVKVINIFSENVMEKIPPFEIDTKKGEVDKLITEINELVKVLDVINKNSGEITTTNSIVEDLSQKLMTQFNALSEIKIYLQTESTEAVRKHFKKYETEMLQFKYLVEHNTKCTSCENRGYVWVPDENPCTPDPNGHCYDDMHREKCPKCKGTLEVPEYTYTYDIDKIMTNTIKNIKHIVDVVIKEIDDCLELTAEVK